MYEYQIKEFKNYYRLFIDGDYYGPLYLGEIRDLGIDFSGEVDEEDLAAIHIVIFKRGLKKAVDLLTVREYSSFDIRQKLRLKDYPDFMIDLIIERAKELRFLDERRYAECYIRSNLGKKSRTMIFAELKNKGIPEDFMSEAYEEIAYDLGYDEEEVIKEIILRKFRNVDFSDEKAKNRVISYFLRHGYSLGSIKNYLT